MDLNYTAWLVRNAMSLSTDHITSGIHTIEHNVERFREDMSAQNNQLRDAVNTLSSQLLEMAKRQDIMMEKLNRIQQQTPKTPTAPSVHPVSRVPPAPPVHAPQIQPAQARTEPQNRNKGKNPEPNPGNPPAQPQTYANVARGQNPGTNNFQVVQRRKSKPKPDPLFKPEFTKINREIVVETNEASPVTPTEIRQKINSRIQDPDCHLLAARQTSRNNFILETKFVTPASKVMEYRLEIESALTDLKVPFVDIRVNSKWSKFIIHGIPTSIGEGLQAGQLVASEITSNYGTTVQLAQIPRWISKPETRTGKAHSSMVIALPGHYTLENLGLRSFNLFDRTCKLETYLPTNPDTQCRNCLEYGHRQERCKDPSGRCGHCSSDDHRTTEHPCKECAGGIGCTHSPIRCFNCKGHHKATDVACPERAKAKLRAQARAKNSDQQNPEPENAPIVISATGGSNEEMETSH
jgi:hypothetical protein